MTHREHDDRADALDRWLDAWQRGEEPVARFDDLSPDEADPVGDELATAQALRAYCDDIEAPHEPLVALRAAHAARRALREPRWRRRLVTGTRLAPLAAAAAITAVVAFGAVTSDPEPSTPDDAVALARQSLAGVSDQVEFVQARGETLDSDPATIRALLEADRELSKASAAAELADGDTRRLLESQIRALQALVDSYKRQIVVLSTTVPPTTEPPVVASSTTTTSTQPTTTTRPQSTTTTRPQSTTTTRPSTTTTTDEPLEPTSTTTRNEPPSTTTPEPQSGSRSAQDF